MSRGEAIEADYTRIQGLLRKVNPVVNKDGALCPNSVFLAKDKPCIFGRASTGVTAQLVSRTTPLMISRKHATLGFRDGNFSITDHNSLNGVFVNGIRIESDEPYPILSGDKIAFGIAVGTNKDPEFEYIFHQVPQEYNLKRTRVSDGEGSSIEKRRKCETDECLQSGCDSVGSFANSAFEGLIRIQEKRIEELTEQLLSEEQAHSHLALTLEKKEQDLATKLRIQREELEVEKLEAERKLQSLLEQQLKDKENILKASFSERIKAVENERDLVEKNLQKELSNKLTEKDERYRVELEKQKEALNRILSEMKIEKENRELEMSKNQELLNNLKSMKENEMHLGSCLEELKRQIQNKDQELLKQEEITKKAEEDGKKAVLSQMEDEFTCVICHELFVDSVTLSCAHSFCETCLRSWMKKKRECPVCRGRIIGTAVKSVVLDSAIRRMIENADNETKQNREQLVLQRRALREAEQANGLQPLLASDEQHHYINRGRIDAQSSGPPRPQSHLVQLGNIPNQRHMTAPGSNHNDDGYFQSRERIRGRGYGNAATNRNGDRRSLSRENRRNWGHSSPPRQFRGSCYICGNQGHYARNCFFSQN